MMAPDLVVFETGYLEATREEYIKSSLDEDVAFASVTEYRPLSRGVIGSGDHMTVLTKASIKGLFAGQTVDLQQSETMILRRAGTSWEIVHLHWSAHPRQPETVQPQAQAAPPTPPELPSAAVPAREVEPQAPASLKESTELTLPAVTEAKPDEAKTP